MSFHWNGVQFPPQKGGNSFHLWPQHAFQSPHLAIICLGGFGLGKEGGGGSWESKGTPQLLLPATNMALLRGFSRDNDRWTLAGVPLNSHEWWNILWFLLSNRNRATGFYQKIIIIGSQRKRNLLFFHLKSFLLWSSPFSFFWGGVVRISYTVIRKSNDNGSNESSLVETIMINEWQLEWQYCDVK